MNFEFASAGRIIFGAGTAKQIGSLTRAYGERALLVVGGKTERAADILVHLAEAGVQVSLYSVQGEPTVPIAVEARRLALSAQVQVVIGFGGGSALDLAKITAALASNTGDIYDYLEVIGKALPLQQAPLPIIAIPTTAGTGSEVTRNGVLADPEQRVKVSMRHPLMLPRLAIVDPELTYALPPAITASTGMDALTQNIEPYTCNAPTPMTDALSAEGIRRAGRALLHAYQNGQDAQAREDMALASLFGGLALANSKLGAVHGFAAPIGGMFPAPHGAVCAALLPQVMRMNIQVARQIGAQALLSRYQQVAVWLTGSAHAEPEAGAAWVKTLSQALNIPPLSSYGITQADIPTIVEKAAVASSMKGNGVPLSHDALAQILKESL